MTKMEFTFGMDLDRHGEPIRHAEKLRALAGIRALAVQLYGGCTTSHGHGTWRNESGRVFSEKSCTLTILTPQEPSQDTAQRIAETIREVLRQESVVFCLSYVDVIFFS